MNKTDIIFIEELKIDLERIKNRDLGAEFLCEDIRIMTIKLLEERLMLEERLKKK
jgi:hypothetical protein